MQPCIFKTSPIRILPCQLHLTLSCPNSRTKLSHKMLNIKYSCKSLHLPRTRSLTTTTYRCCRSQALSWIAVVIATAVPQDRTKTMIACTLIWLSVRKTPLSNWQRRTISHQVCLSNRRHRTTSPTLGASSHPSSSNLLEAMMEHLGSPSPHPYGNRKCSLMTVVVTMTSCTTELANHAHNSTEDGAKLSNGFLLGLPRQWVNWLEYSRRKVCLTQCWAWK